LKAKAAGGKDDGTTRASGTAYRPPTQISADSFNKNTTRQGKKGFFQFFFGGFGWIAAATSKLDPSHLKSPKAGIEA
jgi:hypothetical protein